MTLIIGLTNHEKEFHKNPKKPLANLPQLEPIVTQGPTETKIIIYNPEIGIKIHEVPGKSQNF